ncbi:MAG: hypothetical protein ABI766_15250 [Gemmatimonadales bacterium]
MAVDPGSVGVLIPIVAIGAWAWVRTAKLKAEGRASAPDAETTGRLQALEQELGALRHELGEAQERLDFAERLLAQRTPDTLRPPG